MSFLAKIEPWTLYYSAVLGILFLYALSAMLWEALRGSRELDSSLKLIASIETASKSDRVLGRSPEVIEQLREKGDRLPGKSAAWWQTVDEAIARYESPDQQIGYFVMRPVEDMLQTDVILDKYYNGSRWHVIPGILTSLGLLGTFIALLLGLSHLAPDPKTHVVAGIDVLIRNLSGKFVTSVVALFLSVVFVGVDTFYCQRVLSRGRDRLVRALTSILPYLSPSRLLLDIQRQMVKQSVHLSNISADVVDKFATVFRADLIPLVSSGFSTSLATQLQNELGPTIERVASVMQELTATVARLESSKQESVVGEFRGLAEALESSIKTSLADMGRQFQVALTASTQDEFGALAGAVKGSAGALESMTTGFVSMEATLRGIVEEARNNTTSQMRASVEQTEGLNRLVEGLMVRLNSAASDNFEQVGAMLTTVVTRLSGKVTQLSEDLVLTVKASTTESQQAVRSTLEQAGEWSAQSSKQLATLLETLQVRGAEFDRAGESLLAAQQVLHATLQQSNEALRALGSASGEVRGYSQALAGMQGKLEEQTRAQGQLATLSGQSVAKLVEAAQRHDDFLTQYKMIFEKYRSIFEGLDEELAQLLGTILERMSAYNRAVEKNFEVIVNSANGVIPTMAGTLKTATEELREQVEELTDTLSKANGRPRGA